MLLATVIFRRDPPPTVPRTDAPQASAQPAAQSPVSAVPIRSVSERFEQIANPKLADDQGNKADTLRINIDGQVHSFSLYFVDALDNDFNDKEKVKDQAAFFGNTTSEAVVETGRDAYRTVANQLSTRPFRVLTRWERAHNSPNYLALIMVQKEDGQWTYLADMLVKQGYARISGITTPLPDDARAMEDYLVELRKHADYARERHLGIWSRVSSVQ